MSSTIQSSRSQLEQKAIKLLGSGLSPGTVATAIGVSESRISQLMSQDDFAAEVTQLRFENLQKHNELDSLYDSMEAKVAKNVEEMLPLITRPADLLKLMSTLNSMKRKGQSAPEQMTHQNTVVNLLMPVQITQKFTTNVNNQVIQAGDQTLQTIQGSSLLAAAKAKSQTALSSKPNDYVLENNVSNSQREVSNERASTETIQARVGALLNSKANNLKSNDSSGNQ